MVSVTCFLAVLLANPRYQRVVDDVLDGFETS